MASVQSFMDDRAVVERVLAHVRNGTTDTGDEVWREPVENYRSEERFQSELALLRRMPVPFCPSVALREPGDYVSRLAAGVPILAVRGKDGIAEKGEKNAPQGRFTGLCQRLASSFATIASPISEVDTGATPS